eukprot:6141547-Pleurochrysis_carterae.AAC.3
MKTVVEIVEEADTAEEAVLETALWGTVRCARVEPDCGGGDGGLGGHGGGDALLEGAEQRRHEDRHVRHQTHACANAPPRQGKFGRAEPRA